MLVEDCADRNGMLWRLGWSERVGSLLRRAAARLGIPPGGKDLRHGEV